MTLFDYGGTVQSDEKEVARQDRVVIGLSLGEGERNERSQEIEISAPWEGEDRSLSLKSGMPG